MRKIFEYIVLSFLVVTSGFQFFYVNEQWIVIGVLFTLFVIIFAKIHVVVNKKAIILILIFLLWEVLQFIILGGFRPRSLFGTLGRLMLAYLTIGILKDKFIHKYISFIKTFSLISLFFYFLLYIPGFYNILLYISDAFNPLFESQRQGYEFSRNILIFNLHGYDFVPKRNSGPFWEPGAFSVFLTIAVLFQMIKDGKFILKNNIIFLITILTTFSTAGYIITSIILIVAFYNSIAAKKIVALITIPVLMIIIFLLFGKIEFLMPKVNNDIEIADNNVTSRFGSALADWRIIQKNPILGYGRNLEIIYGVSYFDKMVMHRNNGATRLFVQWGLLGLLYIYMLFYSFKKIIKLNNAPALFKPLVVLIIFLNGFSQSIFQYPFFLSFMLLFMIGEYKEKNKIIYNKNEI